MVDGIKAPPAFFTNEKQGTEIAMPDTNNAWRTTLC